MGVGEFGGVMRLGLLVYSLLIKEEGLRQGDIDSIQSSCCMNKVEG